MHCFNHQGTAAVVICMSCNRGLCRDCAVPVGSAFACSGTCEANVEAISAVRARNIRAALHGGSPFTPTAILYICFGVVFGVVAWRTEFPDLEFFGLFAPLMVGFGVFYAVRARNMSRNG